jgi:hypothetical protein
VSGLTQAIVLGSAASDLKKDAKGPRDWFRYPAAENAGACSLARPS